jgi:ABC-type lipoprotein release transport system permease subunit
MYPELKVDLIIYFRIGDHPSSFTVAVTASYIPAVRAARKDPLLALRR